MKASIAAAALAGMPWLARAHEGHGMDGPHWHATDAWGFLAAAAAGALLLWWRSK